MENHTITNAWMDVFPISSDETNKIYELLMRSFLAVAIKTLLSRFNKKKKKAHRVEVLIMKPTHTEQREVTPTPLSQEHPLPPTPRCPESQPDTSKTCKICHNDNTQRWWIQCDKCDQWMHPKSIGMLVKDFKVLRDADTGYTCKDCRKLMN